MDREGPAWESGHTGGALQALRLAGFVLLAGSAAVFLGVSIHWPLLGDSAQIHYICFLLDHGMAPYRVTGDMNMPGALLLEWLVMHTLGSGSFAWRCFDLLLVAAGTAAMAVIAGRGHRLAGVGAGLLFLLLHGVDGLNDTGERDLSIAMLLLVGYAALFLLLRGLDAGEGGGVSRQVASLGWSACFGVALGTACCIKPTALPLAAVLLVVLWWHTRRRPSTALGVLAAAMAGLMLPFGAALVFLLRQRALGAFLHGLRTSVPYYASLQHRGVGYLLLHSIAPLLPVVILWLLGPVWGRGWTLERKLLLVGVAFGLFSYLLQAKGFPYYRYPLLAMLLPLMAVDLDSALRPSTGREVFDSSELTGKPGGEGGRRRAVQAVLAAAALVYAAGFLAPDAAWKTQWYRWQDQQLIGSLTGDLHALDARDGEVQCIDSISGCGNTLLRMRLVQATGLLSDFFLFGSPDAPAVREARASFRQAVALGGAPRYLIVTAGLHLHPEDPGHWAKLARWPWFGSWLEANYTLVLTREPTRPALWWARPEMPAAYRVYVRQTDAAQAAMLLTREAGVIAQPGVPLTLPEP